MYKRILSAEEIVRNLAVNILLQAILDKKTLDTKGFVRGYGSLIDEDANQEELNEFAGSEWCLDLCEIANISNTKVKNMLTMQKGDIHIETKN